MEHDSKIMIVVIKGRSSVSYERDKQKLRKASGYAGTGRKIESEWSLKFSTY